VPQSRTIGPRWEPAGPGPDVNGRPTDKYTYDATQPDGAKFHSEVLVDREDQYTLTWDVTGETKNNDTMEPFSWSYALSDINAVPTIAIPDACAKINASAWPIPSDGTITMQTADMFSVTTPQSVADIAKFYTEAMTSAGYRASDGGMQTPDMVSQVYILDNTRVTVMISASAGTTTVIITQE
jgi:hypothetical protein